MANGAARVEQYLDRDELLEELGFDFVLELGAPIAGVRYLAHHLCPRCEAEMQTVGVAHQDCICSGCEAKGSVIVMRRTFERLED